MEQQEAVKHPVPQETRYTVTGDPIYTVPWGEEQLTLTKSALIELGHEISAIRTGVPVSIIRDLALTEAELRANGTVTD